MSLQTNLQDFATDIGTKIKEQNSRIGNNIDLTTAAKSTLVAAINEINAKPTGTGGATINDGAINATQTWSSSKSNSEIQAAIAALVAASPAALDTLNELAAALGNDPNFATTIATQIGGKANTVHSHTAAQISDASALGRTILQAATAADARTAIGAGTSSLVLGTAAGTAKAGDYQPAAANISDSTATGRGVLTASTPAIARTAIGAGTSELALGTTSTTAKAGDYQPTSTQISDATATGRSVLTAATAAAARTAIGAGVGSSNLAIGTTSTTAKAGDYQPTAANISDATATGRSLLTTASVAAARTTLDVYSKAEIGNPETDLVATFRAALA